MSKAIIFTGGGAPLSLPNDLTEEGDCIIAADSGYDTANQLGYRVDLAIGDFDSTKLFAEIETLQHKKSSIDKDESDTELAIREAFSLGFDQYILIGGGGYRMDHLFASYALFSRLSPPLWWYTTYETMKLVRSYERFSKVSIGQTVSFLPIDFSNDVQVTAENLAWPLKNYQLSMQTISLSNRVVATPLDVFVSEGKALFVSFPVAPRHL